ncbi:hypothetical protein [Microbacterium sp. 1.5R]|uniref:hypothetical protein n=1 Tax=Microbacterium sp. 1.5R TaxID=1916917 RepID=UPI00119DA5F1|nr:hypothetical protein [Microbacterium sp. 1.5R]
MKQNGENDEELTEAARRDRLRAIEAEHKGLLEGTLGRATVFNAELIGRQRDLEEEADEIRAQLGEPPQGSGRSGGGTLFGWVALVGAVVAILAGSLLLTPR